MNDERRLWIGNRRFIRRDNFRNGDDRDEI